MGMDTYSEHSDMILLRKTTFVISYLLFGTPSPFWKGVYFDREDFVAQEQVFFLWEYTSVDNGRKNISSTVGSHIHSPEFWTHEGFGCFTDYRW